MRLCVFVSVSVSVSVSLFAVLRLCLCVYLSTSTIDTHAPRSQSLPNEEGITAPGPGHGACAETVLLHSFVTFFHAEGALVPAAWALVSVGQTGVRGSLRARMIER